MIDLSDFLFKNVEVKDNENHIYNGYVDMFESSNDNDTDEDSIGIILNSSSQTGIELYQSEIKSIKLT